MAKKIEYGRMLHGGDYNPEQWLDRPDILQKDIEYFKSSLLYYGIIACFVIGAIIGNLFIHILQEKAILCCSALLFFVFFLMFIDFEREKL